MELDAYGDPVTTAAEVFAETVRLRETAIPTQVSQFGAVVSCDCIELIKGRPLIE